MFYFERTPYPDLGVIEGNYFELEPTASISKEYSLLAGGYEKCGTEEEDVKAFRFRSHLLKFIVSGRATLSAYGKTFALSKGMVIGFPPDTDYSISGIKNKSITYLYVLFSGQDAIRFFTECDFENKVMVRLENPDVAGSLFWRILRHGNNVTQYAHDLCSSYLKTLLIELKVAPDIKEHKASLATLTYKQCKDYMDRHFNEIKTVNQVAEHCCLSPQYLSRLFLRLGNMSPHNYLLRLKLNTAANLLVTSTLSVSQIAQQVGFDDPFYFSSCFKKKLGMAPSKYRSKYMEIIE